MEGMGATPLGIGVARSPPFPDQLLPRHVFSGCPGIRQRVALPPLAATARRRPLRHASPRPLVFSPGDGVPRHCAATSIGVQGECFQLPRVIPFYFFFQFSLLDQSDDSFE